MSSTNRRIHLKIHILDIHTHIQYKNEKCETWTIYPNVGRYIQSYMPFPCTANHFSHYSVNVYSVGMYRTNMILRGRPHSDLSGSRKYFRSTRGHSNVGRRDTSDSPLPNKLRFFGSHGPAWSAERRPQCTAGPRRPGNSSFHTQK